MSILSFPYEMLLYALLSIRFLNRLILKVLSDEVRNTTPFRSENVEDATIRLLNALHEVFTVHPPSANSVSSTGNNDTAFCTAKTVIFQVRTCIIYS